MVEICDNGIDDDGDGFIDLNDTECECSDLESLSLIPNPSFEDMTCCPMTEGALDCAVSWIQASAPTTDYAHECGVLGNPFLGYEAPLPFPDGQGGIGFRDGRAPAQGNYKEYAGACLTQAMEQGIMYRLDFFVGFHDAPGSTTFDMAVFGSMNCSDLPFGNGDVNHGCPTNGVGWDLLGEMTVSGENEWKNVVFEFEALNDYETIVLGPACAPNPNVAEDPYFYFDRLAFAKASSFVTPLSSIDGDICEGSVTLTADGDLTNTFQWYFNGVAIIGETASTIVITQDFNGGDFEGEYEVVVSNAVGCASSAPYTVLNEQVEIFLEEQICEGETIEIDGNVFDSTDVYVINVSTSTGCDSIINLDLTVLELIEEDIMESFCTGSDVTVNGVTYDTGGNFTQNLTSSGACDSLLNIEIIELPITSATESFQICMGDSITINNEVYDATGNYTQTLVNSNGCDSILNISLELMPNMEMTEVYEICMGETLTINNENYNATGTYVQTITNASGCVTILNIVLTVLPVSNSTEEYVICNGESIVINNQSYNAAGTYVQDITDNSGCASILTIIIEEEEANSFTELYEICAGESVTVNGETYAFPGTYLQTSFDVNGCESILTVIVDELSTSNVEEDYEICLGDTLSLNGVAYASTGIYTQVFTAVNGCDSTLMIQLTVENNCSDCIFHEDMNTGNFTIQKTSDQLSQFILYFDGAEIINQELNAAELSSMLALVNLENELHFSKGSIGKQSLFQPGKIDRFLEKNQWQNQRSFKEGSLNKLLHDSDLDVTEGQLNYDKLDYSYQRMMGLINDLKVGAKISYTLR